MLNVHGMATAQNYRPIQGGVYNIMPNTNQLHHVGVRRHRIVVGGGGQGLRQPRIMI